MRTHALAAALVAIAVAGLHAPRAEAGRGIGALKYLADATDAVVLVDVAKGRKSPVFQAGFALASDKLPILAIIKLDKIDTVLAGHVSSNEVVAIFEGKIDGLVAQAKQRSTATATHAGITYWTTPDGEVAVIGKRLVVASPKTIEAVIDRAADKTRAKGPARVRGWLAAGPPGASVVVAAMPDATVAKDLTKRFGRSPQLATCWVGTGANLTIDGRAVFADDASAEAAAKALNATVSPDVKHRLEAFVGKEFADSVHIDRDHAGVRASAVMTAEEVDKVVGFARLLM